jgi:D-ribulokinase
MSPVNPLIAGIDLATGHARVVVADERGELAASAECSLAAPYRPAPGLAEQDADSWWPATASALRQATASLGSDARRIVAVAPTATSGTVVLVGHDGRPTGPALLYNDQRASAWAQRADSLGSERWRACGMRIAPSFALAKLGWLAAKGELAAAASAWSGADLIVARLTGEEPMTDWSHALKTGYDAVRREWPTEVLEALHVPTSLLPEVAAPGTNAGCVSRSAAAETGLPQSCEVRLGMTDGCTSQIACGAVTPGSFASVLGTTLVVKGASTTLIHDSEGVVYSHLHPGGRLWLPGGASNTGAEGLASFARHTDLRHLDALAAERGPASIVSYPLARVGERFPFLEPSAAGFTTGVPQDDADAFRARLEGVAFIERLAYDLLGTLGARPAGPIAIAGGTASSHVWNRIRATVLQRPLRIPRRPESAFGAAIIAAAGSAHDDLAAATAAMIRYRHEVEPADAETAALEDSYLRLIDELNARGWVGEALHKAAHGGQALNETALPGICPSRHAQPAAVKPRISAHVQRHEVAITPVEIRDFLRDQDHTQGDPAAIEDVHTAGSAAEDVSGAVYLHAVWHATAASLDLSPDVSASQGRVLYFESAYMLAIRVIHKQSCFVFDETEPVRQIEIVYEPDDCAIPWIDLVDPLDRLRYRPRDAPELHPTRGWVGEEDEASPVDDDVIRAVEFCASVLGGEHRHGAIELLADDAACCVLAGDEPPLVVQDVPVRHVARISVHLDMLGHRIKPVHLVASNIAEDQPAGRGPNRSLEEHEAAGPFCKW